MCIPRSTPKPINISSHSSMFYHHARKKALAFYHLSIKKKLLSKQFLGRKEIKGLAFHESYHRQAIISHQTQLYLSLDVGLALPIQLIQNCNLALQYKTVAKTDHQASHAVSNSEQSNLFRKHVLKKTAFSQSFPHQPPLNRGTLPLYLKIPFSYNGELVDLHSLISAVQTNMSNQ